ncbi:BQ2448_1791 [Microbotryum intermedium]|uniref:BQ2448_1791 protein n=1 Tax=Microbotryum intermedium TaxID=269621 RepID=A0A238FB59_9BASI|nr:BQ2448_1791 [Microbotryum intermedium]
MGLLETSILEEVPFHSEAQKPHQRDALARRRRNEPSSPAPPPLPSSSSSSSSSTASASVSARHDVSNHSLSPRESNKKIEEKSKVIAAMVGATLTSLTSRSCFLTPSAIHSVPLRLRSQSRSAK